MSIQTIARISIKGFKSIREMDIEMRPFTVLIGANGAGKSNLIQFFEMLQWTFRTTTGMLQMFVSQKGGASTLLHYGPGVTEELRGGISVVVADLQNEYEYKFSISGTLQEGLPFSQEALNIEYPDDSGARNVIKDSAPYSESRVLDKADTEPIPTFRDAARRVRDTARNIRVYHFHNTSETAAARLTQDVTVSGNTLGAKAENLWTYLYELKLHRPAYYKQILSTVQLVAPYIQDFILEPGVNPQYLLMRWQDRSGEIFGPHQISDGTLRAIALIAALLQPEDLMPSIMIFDEPELGLHPAAIGLVASLLKAASLKRQVIVATQSPLLIREYEPEDIVVVERPEDENGRGESTFTRLEREDLGAWLEDYDLGDLYEKNVTGGGPR